MAAAEAVLDEILERRIELYAGLDTLAHTFVDGLTRILQRLNVPALVHAVGPMISLFLTTGHTGGLNEYREVRRHGNFDRYVDFQQYLQRSGVYFHPNMFEPMYLSTAHTLEDIDLVLERVAKAARACLLG